MLKALFLEKQLNKTYNIVFKIITFSQLGNIFFNKEFVSTNYLQIIFVNNENKIAGTSDQQLFLKFKTNVSTCNQEHTFTNSINKNKQSFKRKLLTYLLSNPIPKTLSNSNQVRSRACSPRHLTLELTSSPNHLETFNVYKNVLQNVFAREKA